MSWRGFERKFLRPIGKGLKAAAPIAGAVVGGAVGGPLGAGLGSALGGMAKRGKFDLSDALLDAGTGALTSGIAGRLGITGKLSGALAKSGIPGVADGAANQYLNAASGKLAGSLATAGTQGAGSLATNAARAAGSLKAGAPGMAQGLFSDPAKLQALGAAGQAGASIYGAQKADALEREQWEWQRARQEEEDEEERRTAAALAPYTQSLMEGMRRRIGTPGGSGYVAGYLEHAR